VKRVLLMAAAVVFGLAVTVYAAAGEKKETKKTTPRVNGKITRIDATARSITVLAGKTGEQKSMTFVVNDDTKIMEGKEMRKFEDLKQDMTVTVAYEEGPEPMTALWISIKPLKKAAG
jgi:hypothetical protein